MSKSIICKLLQKQTYDILSHKYSLVLCFIGLFLVIISAFRFGEVVIEWSMDKYVAVFNSFSDNIIGKSYQKQLCQHLPIDVVYTWVNGTDPQLLEDLARQRRAMEQELNETRIQEINTSSNRSPKCPYAHCIESHMVILRPTLPSSLTMEDLVEEQFIFTDAKHMFLGTGINGITDDYVMGTVVVFDSREAAIVCQQRGIIPIRQHNYTVHPAHLTSDWTAPNTILLEDTIIMAGVPSHLTQEQLHTKLPSIIRNLVSKIFLYPDKSLAVLLVHDKAALTSVLSLEGNFTIDNKEPSISAANLILHFTENTPHEDISSSRFQDNEELRYSLRSIEKFAPWIRHVFIVTNGQIPYWLNLENPRISVITHQQLYPNTSHLPTFSSPSIEAHLHRIPGLSQKFLYLNDDVIFGKEIWPEDFYTQAKGHKVYLSWGVPECRDGCPSSWISDGYCDKPCNNSDCQWDGGDCKDGGRGMIFNANTNQLHPHFQMWKEESEKIYCVTNCANTWLADRYCDQACNIRECGYDAGDCGTSNYDQLYSIDLDESIHLYSLPPGIHLAYFNLTTFLGDDRTATDGSFEENSALRVVAVNQKFKILTLVLHTNNSATLLILAIKGVKSGLEYEFQFNITVDTSVMAPPSSIVNRTKTAKMADSSTIAVPTTVMTTTPTTIKMETFASEFRSPHVITGMPTSEWATSSYDLVNVSAANLPLDIAAHLNQLEELFIQGELTYKGFRKKKAKLIGEYVQKLNASNQTVPAFHYVDPQNQKAFMEAESRKLLEKTIASIPAIQKATTMIGLSSEILKPFVPIPTPERKVRQLKGLEDHESREIQFVGSLPWEKRGTFVQLQKKRERLLRRQEYESAISATQRQLLDTFGDSLRHVNRLLNKEFGFEARKVPAHMAHMVDVQIINKMQARFANEFDETSSHKIRSTKDMQFAFSFFYFLMSEVEPFEVEKVFDEFDTDHSGTWSDREVRTVLARLHELPITFEVVHRFENTIMNCSRHLPPNLSEGMPTPPFERYLDSKLPTISKELVSQCDTLVTQLRSHFRSRKKHKFEIVGEEEVAFKMIHTNMSQVIAQLDDIRKKPRKFICLNDNIDHRSQEANMVKAVLIDFYESFFPIPSQFELPREYRNRFLHVKELEGWRYYRNIVRITTYVCLGAMVVLSVASFFHSEVAAVWRKIFPRRQKSRLSFPSSSSKPEMHNV